MLLTGTRKCDSLICSPGLRCRCQSEASRCRVNTHQVFGATQWRALFVIVNNRCVDDLAGVRCHREPMIERELPRCTFLHLNRKHKRLCQQREEPLAECQMEYINYAKFMPDMIAPCVKRQGERSGMTSLPELKQSRRNPARVSSRCEALRLRG